MSLSTVLRVDIIPCGFHSGRRITDGEPPRIFQLWMLRKPQQHPVCKNNVWSVPGDDATTAGKHSPRLRLPSWKSMVIQNESTMLPQARALRHASKMAPIRKSLSQPCNPMTENKTVAKVSTEDFPASGLSLFGKFTGGLFEFMGPAGSRGKV